MVATTFIKIKATQIKINFLHKNEILFFIQKKKISLNKITES